MDNFTIRQKWLWPPITLCIVGIAALGMLLRLAQISEQQRVDFSRAALILEFQSRTTSIQRWFAEGLFDAPSMDVDRIRQGFDCCTSLLDTLLYGGPSTSHPHVPSLQAGQVRTVVESLQALLVSLQTTTIQRYETPAARETDSALTETFKTISLELQAQAQALAAVIAKDQMSNDTTWKALFMLIMCAWAFMIGVSTFGLWRVVTQRRKSATALHSTHGDLRAQTVTARQERAPTFAQLAQEFHPVLDAIPDFLVLLAPDLTVQWGNRHAMRALGHRLTELPEPYCWCLWTSSSAPRDDCLAARTLRTGHAESRRVLRPDGRIWDLHTFPLLDGHGHVSNVLEMVRDVTEQMTMQDAAARLAHLASLGQLAAGVAHEITNPLNGIINYAQILVDATAGGEEEADIAGRIVKEGNRIATVVASLLSFAQAQGTEKTLVSLHATLADTLALVGRQLDNDGIILHVQVDTALPPVMAHEQQMEQVFLDLIHNAREALNLKYPNADAGKILEILGAHVSVEGRPHIQVTFHDHGVGISANILPKVLEPFFSTKPRRLGTGLGLSISHDIITDHGGRLVIESVESVFTKVHVILPSGGEAWTQGS